MGRPRLYGRAIVADIRVRVLGCMGELPLRVIVVQLRGSTSRKGYMVLGVANGTMDYESGRQLSACFTDALA